MPNPKIPVNLGAFRLFLFDLDGTLIEGSDHHFVHCVRETAREFGKADFLIPRGAPLSIYIRENWAGATEEFIAEFRRRNRQRMLTTPRPVQFHADTIAFLNVHTAKPRALVTNCQDWELALTEKSLDLRAIFPHIIFKEPEIAGKPAPDLYLKAASSFAISPEYCLVFEDSATGIAAGKRAGMTVIGIDRGVHTEFAAADHVVTSFYDLLTGN